MKSLEHIIREIHEGKAEKAEKKSLEGSIRNIMSKESSYAAKDSKPVDEHCGCEEEKKKKVSKEDGDDRLPGSDDKMDEAIGTIGTNEYQGNQFKSVRTQTPHIKPPAGADGHSQAPENVSRQRTFAKERVSQTMQTHMRAEETVDEGLVDTAIKAGFQYAKPYIATTGRALVKYGEKAAEKLGIGTKAAKELPKPAEAPKLAPPETAPTAPKPELKAPEVKPAEVKPAEVKPEVKTAETKPAEVKPEIKTAEVKPAEVKTTEVKPKVSTVPETPPAVKPKTPVEPVTKTPPPVEPSPAVKTPSIGSVLPKIAGPAAALAAAALLGRGGSGSDDKWLGKPKIGAPTRIHKAKHLQTEARKEIENMPREGDRKTIQYVGREDADPKTAKEKTSRQATIKNVIDESKKLAGTIKTAVKEKEQRESGGKDQPTKVFDYNPGDYIVVRPDLNKNTLDVK